MSEKNLNKAVCLLLVLAVITFLAGFLQSTQFEFIIYVFYFILLVGGVVLIHLALKSGSSRTRKFFLLLTGASLASFFPFFIIAVILNLVSGLGITETLTELEGVLYVFSLFFLIGVVGSIYLSFRE